APRAFESVASSRLDYIFVYMYPFSMGLGNHIDEVIISYYNTFYICLGQLSSGAWRVIAFLRALATLASEEFSLEHLLLLYSPRLVRRGIIQLKNHGKKSLLGDLDDI
ncbi:hypothetical protein HAX54_027685, partial [Datura stramonium]|nr:hypothetical protein [Datura stramonium]